MDNHAWDRRYADSEFIWTVHPNHFLVEEAASLAPGRALDLACGEGRNAVWLAQRGWEVIGVDFSQAKLDGSPPSEACTPSGSRPTCSITARRHAHLISC